MVNPLQRAVELSPRVGFIAMFAFSTIQRTLILPVVLFLAVLVSQYATLSPIALAQYDDGGPIKYPCWSDQPEYRSSLQPSIGQPGYEQRRYQQEREDLSRNQDQLRGYHQEPPASLGYNPPSVTILSNGKSMTCYGPTKGIPNTVCF